MTAKPDLTLPVVHLNGTSREALLEQACAASRAVEQAIRAAAEASPNGRDYYPKPGTYEKALAEHTSRVARLRSVLDEYLALAEGIADA